MSAHEARALKAYREMHPDVDDVPDEVVVKLIGVQALALRYAFNDLGRELLSTLRRDWPWILALWLLLFAAAAYFA